MTNEERIMNLFIEQYPQYKEDRDYLCMNLYCDIMDNRNPEGRKIIAVSDLPHSLTQVGYLLPKSWELKQ